MRWKFILGLLTTCAVLMSMSYTMLIPFLPMYLIQDLGVVKADVDMWSGAIFCDHIPCQRHHGADLGCSCR